MTSGVIRSSCMAALLAVCSAASVAQTAEMLDQPEEPFRIADDVYFVGTHGLSSFLIATAKGHILVDGGFVRTIPMIRRNVEKLGFRMEDIRYILVGHAHPDHVAGLADIYAASGAGIIVGERDADLVERGVATHEWPGAPVAVRVQHGDLLNLLGRQFYVWSTPGHSKGCTSWTTVARSAGRFHNMAFVCSLSVSGGTRLVNNAAYPEIASDYARTFRLLEHLPCDLWVTEHPQGFSMARKKEALKESARENPFVDPQGCRQMIVESKMAFEERLAAQKEASK